MENYFIVWIVIFIFICLIEIGTQQLVAIWFAAGSLLCVFLSYFGFDLSVQLIAFIIVSCVAMVLLRPYAMNRLKAETIATNAEELIGKTAVVMEDFNVLTREGRVLVEGLDWAAKSISGDELKKGQEVIIQQIEGVKLLVIREE